jgi:O-antigen/teichoic acid export membrane protein
MYLLISNTVSLIALYIFIKTQASLPILLIFLTGTMNFAALGLSLHLVFRYGLSLRWSSLKNTIETFSNIRQVGSHFFLMQITSTMLSILPFSLIAYYHGAAMVTNYGIMMQVMMAIQIPFTITHQPLWTKITQLYLLKDLNNLKNIIKKYFKYALFYSIISTVLLIFGVDYLFLIFFRKNIQIDLSLKIAFAIWGVFGLIGGGGIVTMIIAIRLTKQMAKISFFQLLIYVFAAIILIPTYDALGSVLAIIFAYILTLPFLFNFVLRSVFYSHR